MRFRLLLAGSAGIVLLAMSGCFSGPDGLTSRNRAPEIVSLTVNGQETITGKAPTPTPTPGSSADPTPSPSPIPPSVFKLTEGHTAHFACTVRDEDGDAMVIQWSPSLPSTETDDDAARSVTKIVTRADATPTPPPGINTQNQYDWNSGANTGKVTITCTVSDEKGNTTSRSVELEIIKKS